MEKHPQDKSSVNTKEVTGQDPDRYEQGYGSFTEEDFDKKDVKEENLHETPGGTVTGDSEHANIKTPLNAGHSTVSDTSAPSAPMSKTEDTNSTSS